MDIKVKPGKVFNSKIKISAFTRSPVDILIPFHNEYDKVNKLIYSIILSVKSNPYQITLIDDGSANPDFITEFKDFDKNRPMGSLPILQFVRLEERVGFARALQAGFERTKQPWIMILHSDCVVEDSQWMIEMGRSLLANKQVKMAGAKSGQKENQRMADLILEGDNYLPLYCAMCHRDLFRNIGGFIRDYTGYEDQELGYRMQHYGYKQAVCGNAYIKHEGSGTYNSLFKVDKELPEKMDAARNQLIIDLQKFTALRK